MAKTIHEQANELLKNVGDIRGVVNALREIDAPIAILGNAPSINDLDKSKLDDCITLGVNRISRFYTPNVLLYTEGDMFSPDDDLLFPDVVASEAVVKISYAAIERPMKSIPILKIPPYELGFEWHGGIICKQAIYSIIHIAMLSGCSPVYICGVDLSSKFSHFWGDKPPTPIPLPPPDPNDDTIVNMIRPDGNPADVPRYRMPELLKRGFRKIKWADIKGHKHFRKYFLPFMADDTKNLKESQTKRFEQIADLYKEQGLERYNASRISKLKAFPKSDKLNRSGITHKRGKNGRQINTGTAVRSTKAA